MNLRSFLLPLFLVASLPPSSRQQDEDIPHHEVKNWALKFGIDLWEFGRQMADVNDVHRGYVDHDAQVVRKDGLILIREMAQEVKNMMDIKMNSIMRIMDSAEQAALSHRMDSEAGGTKYLNSRLLRRHSDSLVLQFNRHFDQRHVNTSHSSVIIPQFLSDTDAQVVNALKWSEHLDPVFVNNYEVDPTLSWQYFGSSTGFLRRFPAMQWPPEESSNPKDLHDFRTSNWYVGASTSPKDLAILMDVSSGMKGDPLKLARLTVTTIINTLGDDDYVSIYTFSETTQELVPCFKDMMVQGTEMNKRELIAALDSVSIGNGANFSAALVTGFDILQKYNRTGKGSQCNQALMLVTIGHKGDFKHIVKEYNAPHMPVRVFTYLVGKDTSNSQELFGMACDNKGYYEHIDKPDNIQEKVLNYLRVMARPMVMYQNDHPIHWTPVYAGGQSNTLVPDSDPDAQLMTTVSTPIFDRRNTSVRTANLLGVVGNDIAIQQIKKLVPPYKVGVNGYSFIVNNNGHILYHPDLRPLLDKNLFVETLKPNYNSIDLTSVELLDAELSPRDNNSLLNDSDGIKSLQSPNILFGDCKLLNPITLNKRKLRNDMVNQREGETELKVKIHSDGMRRVTSRRQKYFYHPIEGTPFSLGLVLPDGYGLYEVLAEQEIKLSQTNITEYFTGNNWRVHPEWVYCEYNYAGEHKFSSPEDQVLHFLSRTRRPGWKWMSLRPRSLSRPHEPGHNTAKKMEKESYYCDKTLMQSLVFDAMVVDGWRTKTTIKEDSHRGYEMFGVELTFIATRSGLLRWQTHLIDPHDAVSFGDANRNAIDQSWYKRAVEQHEIEPKSFVFSVPFNAGKNPKTVVTATHAIFLEHKGHKAPLAVVGIQYKHSVFSQQFLNVTAACTGTSKVCKKTCASKDLDCYVLDNNGFIIISEKPEQTGHFFGEADGTIMDSLVQDGIYKRIPIVDHQGACTDSKAHYSDASHRSLPWMPFKWFFKWALTKLIWLSAQTQILSFFNIQDAFAQEDIEGQISYAEYDGANVEYGVGLDVDPYPIDKIQLPENKEVLDEVPPLQAPDPPVFQQKPHQNRTQYARPCVKKVDLYMLQPERLNNSGLFNPLKGKLTNCHATGCERPFSVQKIYHSNLILLVVDTLCPCGSKQLSITPQEVEPEDGDSNCRPWEQNFHRRRPSKCINYHPEEIEIKQCGRGAIATCSIFLLVVSHLILGYA